MAVQRLAVKTSDGYLELNGSIVSDRGQDPRPFIMKSTGPIQYGATIQLWYGTKQIQAKSSQLRVVPLLRLPWPPPVVDFVLTRTKGSSPTFGDGSEFALVCKLGCVRCSGGNVTVSGAFDTDTPTKLYAVFKF